MLRRKSTSTETPAPGPKGFVPVPSSDEPFVVGHAPVGLHFYRRREAFYLSYAALHSMHLNGGVLTLVFATDQVRIEGRGLHSLYALIAEHKVRRVHEQGERYEALAGDGVFVKSITWQSRPASQLLL